MLIISEQINLLIFLVYFAARNFPIISCFEDVEVSFLYNFKKNFEREIIVKDGTNSYYI